MINRKIMEQLWIEEQARERALEEDMKAIAPQRTEPYQQPDLLVFGQNRQTPGVPVDMPFTVAPSVRTAALKNKTLREFVKAADNMAKGIVTPRKDA